MIVRLLVTNRSVSTRAFELSRWRGGRYRVVGLRDRATINAH
jgi:hypothetical protein